MYDCCEEIDIRDGQVNSFLIENRPHFEALYLVLNLGNSEAIIRALNLSELWRYLSLLYIYKINIRLLF